MSQYHSPFQPVLPDDEATVCWGRLYGAAPALAIAQAARRHPGPVLVATGDMPRAQGLETELRFFLSGADDVPVLIFPDWETLPYDVFSPHQDIVSRRLETLYRLPGIERGVLILPVGTLMQRLAPREYLERNALIVERGDHIDPDSLRRRLEAAGYRRVSQVVEHGEYAVRGALVDLYPMGAELPYRIDLFDDEVETLRRFDPDNQRTIEQVDHIRLLPAREFPLTEDAIGRFRQAFRQSFEGDPQAATVYRDVSQGLAPGGVEYYLPLFFERTDTLFDYLPEGTLVVETQALASAAVQFREQVEERYEAHRHDRERPILAPDRLYLEPSELEARVTEAPRVALQAFEIEGPEERCDRAINFATAAPPDLQIRPRAGEPAAALSGFLAEHGGRVLFAAESAGRREALLELLADHGIHPSPYPDWSAFADGEARLGITVAPLERGLVVEEPDLALVAESQIFGERALQRRRRGAPTRDADQVIRDLTDLDVGAPVVHEEHGVGRYQGMQRLAAGGVETEYLTLEYEGGDKLYVPVSSLHLISRYTGASPEATPLHRLGGEQWQRTRRKAAQRARDAAAELLDIYARRAAREGHGFQVADAEYQAFATDFPFEETADQQTAIDSVLADMQAARPMDRVVCGDVGFGKTEVAMRAAFVAVQDGHQVAVFVPTTLLAQQHYQNFLDRFADWPVHIEALSRFRSKREQTRVLEDLHEGRLDIVIGTHKLLQSDVHFKNLGLVIVDEEHRFGVRQKERLKSLRAEVDVLTLTATPIPRTLNMSLAGLRDLSIIATPPPNRLAIKTFVSRWNDTLIREAVLREIGRGGQVYFLHNDVDTIHRIAEEAGRLVPEASVRVAHGQMRERDLEQVMLDFYHRRFNVLVCTTIIESGIDVPSANTMIVNRADRMGLAQLHQLRGRVGRSHHRAYTYLITPPPEAMTPDAVKRLEAIESLEDLGAGFTLATHDLEIRGAGELLGEEQSGQIQEIGFRLYNELLERAVQALKAGREPALDEPLDHGPEVDLQVPALIPDDYLPDVHTRLIMYKRIASAESPAALNELQVEMIDRFGLLPTPTRNLFRLTELKLKAAPLKVRKIEAGPQGGRIVFGPEPPIDAGKIVQLVQSRPQTYRLDGTERLSFSLDLPDVESRLDTLRELLDRIALPEAA